MISVVYSAAIAGIEAQLIEVQVDVSRGLPCLDMVGLPGASIREARQRVRSALRSAGLDYPLARITVNLAPAGLRKEGSWFDLPIALAIAMASSQLSHRAGERLIAIGELGLNAAIRPVNGVLSVAEMTKALGEYKLIIPSENLEEANVIPGLEVIPADHLSTLIKRLKEPAFMTTTGTSSRLHSLTKSANTAAQAERRDTGSDLKYVVGLETAKRCLEIAASGGHNLLMIGPPGSGKSMLASCVPGILPPLTLEEAIEATKIHSVAGILDRSSPLLQHRPFRAPHHSTTLAGLIGGGRPVRPGELSLAHNGVLHLDELGEFRREVIDALREPLDTGRVILNKNLCAVEYPCRMFLIASLNPCPCGYYGSQDRECLCTDRQIRAYRSVLSGPFLDRMDMTITVVPVATERLAQEVIRGSSEDSTAVRSRVCEARDIQLSRFKKADIPLRTNSQLTTKDLRTYCGITPEAERILISGGNRLMLTGRGMTRSLKVARTIADMEGQPCVLARHVAEALQFRLPPGMA
jgi:magnesium chelatase family protein